MRKHRQAPKEGGKSSTGRLTGRRGSPLRGAGTMYNDRRPANIPGPGHPDLTGRPSAPRFGGLPRPCSPIQRPPTGDHSLRDATPSPAEPDTRRIPPTPIRRRSPRSTQHPRNGPIPARRNRNYPETGPSGTPTPQLPRKRPFRHATRPQLPRKCPQGSTGPRLPGSWPFASDASPCGGPRPVRLASSSGPRSLGLAQWLSLRGASVTFSRWRPSCVVPSSARLRDLAHKRYEPVPYRISLAYAHRRYESAPYRISTRVSRGENRTWSRTRTPDTRGGGRSWGCW